MEMERRNLWFYVGPVRVSLLSRQAFFKVSGSQDRQNIGGRRENNEVRAAEWK